jgi:hypothetical protein
LKLEHHASQGTLQEGHIPLLLFGIIHGAARMGFCNVLLAPLSSAGKPMCGSTGLIYKNFESQSLRFVAQGPKMLHVNGLCSTQDCLSTENEQFWEPGLLLESYRGNKDNIVKKLPACTDKLSSQGTLARLILNKEGLGLTQG